MDAITAKLEPEKTVLKLLALPGIFRIQAKKGITRALIAAADKVTEAITQNKYGVKTRTGRLRASFQPQGEGNIFSILESKSGILGKIGSNVKYAAIQERGGIVKAKNVKYLKFQIEGRWISKKQVTIPAHYYVRNTLLDNKDFFARTAMREIMRGIQSGK